MLVSPFGKAGRNDHAATDPEPTDVTAQEVVARLAMTTRAFPARTAIRHGPACCTYAQLWAASERVAAGLRDHGVRARTPLGIGLPASIPWLAAVLGIAKCDASCALLDPQRGREWLAQRIADTGARYVISNREHRHLFSGPVLPIEALLACRADGRHPESFLPFGATGATPAVEKAPADGGAECVAWAPGACPPPSPWHSLWRIASGATMVLAEADAIPYDAQAHGATALRMAGSIVGVSAKGSAHA